MKVLARAFARIEDGVTLAALAATAILPLVDGLLGLLFHVGIPAGAGYVSHAVLVLAFAAALVTTREGRHLGLGSGAFMSGRAAAVSEAFNRFLSVAVTVILALASYSLLSIGFDPAARIGFVPTRVFVAAMPLGFGLMALRFLVAGKPRLPVLAAGLAGLVLGLVAGSPALVNRAEMLGGQLPAFLRAAGELAARAEPLLFVPAILALVTGAFTGAPIFVVLGGLAAVFFSHTGGKLEGIPSEAYELLRGSSIPAIPLFTAAGFLLARSGAGARLVELFRSLIGWLPGGDIVAAVLVCTFFTTFTGATGVTILALGGLLSQVLVRAGGRSEDFARSLITASGSIGLLFPPSLAIIVYAVTAQIDILALFRAAVLPGIILVGVMCAAGILIARGGAAAVPATLPGVAPSREPFAARRAGRAIVAALPELLLPLLVLAGYLTGLVSLAMSAAFALVYVVLVHGLALREFPATTLPKTLVEALAVIGGTLVILAAARGLSFWIIDAAIPARATDWVTSFVGERWVFLLLVNGVLLLTGCFMDIFSAILVVAPLLIPLGESFGVDPLRLGVIFIANMGIGFLTPPVGMNLFLASYAFGKPVTSFFRPVLPYFLAQLAVVLLITFLP